MKKTIITFGLISGLIASVLMGITIPFQHSINESYSYLIGYTNIVVSSLLVFFGIRSYRDNVSGGAITFSRGFLIGLGITVISCCLYVITWEIIYFNFMPDFMDKYAAHAIQKLHETGASAAVIQAKTAQLEHYKLLYKNPLYNAAMTFLEPFPIGLLITLISAAVLRRKPNAEIAAA